MSNLVFQTAFLGDLLLSIPLLKNMKKLFPNEPLVLVCRSGFGAFFLETKLVDQVIEMNKRDSASVQSAMQELQKRDWNWIICPHESVHSALLLRKLKAYKKIGFKKWWNAFFFDQTLVKPYELPDALRQLSLLTLVDESFKKQFNDFVKHNQIQNPQTQTEYSWSFGELPEWASLRLEHIAKPTSEKLVMMAPGSVWNTKRWTVEGYQDLADHFVRQDYRVVLIGTKQEYEIGQHIVHKVPMVENLSGKTSLLELYLMLKRADVLFCNDSGAMHLAAAAGTPTVSVFGPTVLAQGFMPWNSQSVVVQKSLACRPCGRHGGEKCPIGTHECMKNISGKDVLRSYENLKAKIL